MQQVTITTKQARTALEIIERDIASSEFSQPEYRDISELNYYFQRAALRVRLLSALENAKGE